VLGIGAEGDSEAGQPFAALTDEDEMALISAQAFIDGTYASAKRGALSSELLVHAARAHRGLPGPAVASIAIGDA